MKRIWTLAAAAALYAPAAAALTLPLDEVVNTTTSSTGYVVSDGLDDAFDGYARIRWLPRGIDLTRDIATLEDIATYRILDTFTNSTGSTITGTITYQTNLGSDGNETVVEQGADQTISYESWYYTGHTPRGYNDPVLGFLYGDGSGAGGEATGVISRGYFDLTVEFTLDAGESLSFLQFASLIKDDTDRSGDVAATQGLLRTIAADPFAIAGLSPEQIASVANFAAADNSAMVSSVPLPAGFPLLLAGLGAFGLARRRKG